jgi:hypothetical protein
MWFEKFPENVKKISKKISAPKISFQSRIAKFLLRLARNNDGHHENHRKSAIALK